MNFNFSHVVKDCNLWYGHPQFVQYCEYYNDMKNWMSSYRRYLFTQSVNPNQLWNWRVHDTQTSTEVSSNSTSSVETSDEDEDLVMEVSEEMLAFLEKSEKHRQELRLQRAEEDKQTYEITNEKYLKTKKFYNKEVCLPPKDRPGTERTAEMKLLYGKNSAMIHGMETAVQLTFDHNCDLYQPKLWPNIPLKM